MPTFGDREKQLLLAAAEALELAPHDEDDIRAEMAERLARSRREWAGARGILRPTTP